MSSSEIKPESQEDIMKELKLLREYERATRDTICFGVNCTHEAWAIGKMLEMQCEIDCLKKTIRELRGEDPEENINEKLDQSPEFP